MKLIAHRGNINGKIESLENNPNYIDSAISDGYDVEIDVWLIDGNLFLGHDNPQYEVDDRWLEERINNLWVHCKNIDLLNWVRSTSLHYFWHESDTITLTSKNYIWAYPGKQPIMNSIAVMPELNNDDITKCIGICSDYIENYKQK
jgi:hypothetical protein